MPSKHQKLRVRILVQAFPQPSEKHEETVCWAGITEDGSRLLRLFPIRYRRVPHEHQFERFDRVQLTATKASDPRPESFRVDEESIQLIESGRSLGIIRPDPGSVRFTVKPAKDADAADRDIAEQVRQMQQSSLLEDPLVPLEKLEFAFKYQFTSAGLPHGPMMIHDREVQEAYRQYKRRYRADALDHLQRMYGETIRPGTCT